MEYRRIDERDRPQVNSFLIRHWFSTDMIVCGERIDMTKADGIGAFDGAELAGLIMYRFRGPVCDLLSLNSLQPDRGVGTELIRLAAAVARGSGCTTLAVVTTNDNIDAIRFYQKRGFDLARLHRDTLAAARRIKPEIPPVGEHGIPLRHELEFELDLT